MLYAFQPNAAFFQPNTMLNYTDPAGPGVRMKTTTCQTIRTWPWAWLPATARRCRRRILCRRSTRGVGELHDDDPQHSLDGCGRKRHSAKCSIAPNLIDHPGFFVNNPNFPWPSLTGSPPANPQWDVDNDGDGMPDSVWIDIGLPVQTAKDGRQYKKLFAYLCLDLDNRINLNAHGNLAQVNLQVYDRMATGPYAGTGNSNEFQTPMRGDGFGPADVRLSNVVTGNGEVGRLMFGDPNNGLEGRYGERGANTAGPGIYNNDPTTFNDSMALLKFFDYPDNYLTNPQTNPVGPVTSFFSPPDTSSCSMIGLDFRGFPYYSRLQNTEWEKEVRNNPYTLNLSRSKTRVGGGMVRARQSVHGCGVGADSAAIRHGRGLIAPTHSQVGSQPGSGVADVPARPAAQRNHRQLRCAERGRRAAAGAAPAFNPSPMNPWPLSGQAYSIVALLKAKFPGATTVDIAKLLPPELIAGGRLDLNRTLGNGRDDNGNGTVDEAEESANEQAWANVFSTAVNFNLTNQIDVNGDGTIDNKDKILARQLQARYLFVLMMLLRDDTYQSPFNTMVMNGPNELAVRRIAQWAVNVVDFRDSDSIMTPFEYDVNPFNGWQVGHRW